MTKQTVKAIPVTVLSSARYRGCANGGITEQHDELFLACEDGWRDISVDDPRLLMTVNRRVAGKQYTHAEPVNDPRRDTCVGPMMGGSFVYSCDSRFPFDYPIPVHDRFETPREYELLSR